MRYRLLFLQKDTKDIDRVQVWILLNIENTLWRETRKFQIKNIKYAHVEYLL